MQALFSVLVTATGQTVARHWKSRLKPSQPIFRAGDQRCSGGGRLKVANGS